MAQVPKIMATPTTTEDDLLYIIYYYHYIIIILLKNIIILSLRLYYLALHFSSYWKDSTGKLNEESKAWTFVSLRPKVQWGIVRFLV